MKNYEEISAELAKLVEAEATDSRGLVQYAYVAGYYQSVIYGLMRDLPAARKAVESQVKLLKNFPLNKVA